MISLAEKIELTKKFGKNEKDTGSTEVQVAILTRRISNLTPHFSANKHDYHSKTGLMKMIGQRRRLLSYLKNVDQKRYGDLIQELGLRK